MDHTPHDGANVVGNGFSPELTRLMIGDLIHSNVRIIEMGNARGLGATEEGNPAPIGDAAYLDLIHPYLSRVEIGVFLNTKHYESENVAMTTEEGIPFPCIGMDAGDGGKIYYVIEDVKKHGTMARYSLMRVYLLSPEELAEESARLEARGLDEVTVMDPADTTLSQDTGEYVEALKDHLHIPVGFHCHNNLGPSTGNVLATYGNRVDVLDCGLLSMVRSAGNLPTKVAVALIQMKGAAQEVDLYQPLDFKNQELVPVTEKEGYHTPIRPRDLVSGCSGAHSSSMSVFCEVATECGAGLHPLTIEMPKIDWRDPSGALMRGIVARIQAEGAKA